MTPLLAGSDAASASGHFQTFAASHVSPVMRSNGGPCDHGVCHDVHVPSDCPCSSPLTSVCGLGTKQGAVLCTYVQTLDCEVRRQTLQVDGSGDARALDALRLETEMVPLA